MLGYPTIETAQILEPHGSSPWGGVGTRDSLERDVNGCRAVYCSAHAAKNIVKDDCLHHFREIPSLLILHDLVERAGTKEG
jgi:hypothetical protein